MLEKYSDAFVLSEGKSLETSLESLHITIEANVCQAYYTEVVIFVLVYE